MNYEVYIGDNSDYSKNAKCPGGPHMTKPAASSYADYSVRPAPNDKWSATD